MTRAKIAAGGNHSSSVRECRQLRTSPRRQRERLTCSVTSEGLAAKLTG